MALGKELGVPAALVSEQPTEYIAAAILKLEAEGIIRDEQQRKDDHERRTRHAKRTKR